jgi:hypothetical protein
MDFEKKIVTDADERRTCFFVLYIALRKGGREILTRHPFEEINAVLRNCDMYISCDRMIWK